MAQGRLLQKRISKNKDLPALIAVLDAELGFGHGVSAALLYTWCIAHLDVEGRMEGDPCVVRGNVVPRVPHFTDEVVARYLDALHACGLVIRYMAAGDVWLQFPGFHESQPNLRKDREADSRIPPPPEPGASGAAPEECRSNSGVTPAEEKRREEKRNEISPPRAHVEEKFGLGAFDALWRECMKTTPTGNSYLMRDAAERICESAEVAGDGADPLEWATSLFEAFKARRAAWKDAKRPCPALTVEAFSDAKHFATCEEIASGRMKATDVAQDARPRGNFQQDLAGPRRAPQHQSADVISEKIARAKEAAVPPPAEIYELMKKLGEGA